jgi:hypothetical protein
MLLNSVRDTDRGTWRTAQTGPIPLVYWLLATRYIWYSNGVRCRNLRAQPILAERTWGREANLVHNQLRTKFMV